LQRNIGKLQDLVKRSNDSAINNRMIYPNGIIKIQIISKENRMHPTSMSLSTPLFKNAVTLEISFLASNKQKMHEYLNHCSILFLLHS
jgi:hypothetical protein